MNDLTSNALIAVKKRITEIKARLLARPALMWSLVAGFTCAVAVFHDRADTPLMPAQAMQAEPEDAVDTYIPDGFVLVPIEIVNSESLDSVLGQTGVVDLYAQDPGNAARSRRVASRIRIVRAPKNPSQFAVLAPFDQSPALVRQEGGFYVVVQNPKSDGTRFERSSASRPRLKRPRIHVETPNE